SLADVVDHRVLVAVTIEKCANLRRRVSRSQITSLLSITARAFWLARYAETAVRGEKRGNERTSRVARGRLDPDSIENLFALQEAVGDAVEGDAAGKTQIAESRRGSKMSRNRQHDLFGHFLNRRGKVHFAPGDPSLGQARRSTEEL